ncbi:hypothetical protein QWZ10_20375 [Paracoccus cavernae]|uniref:Uncharacterized protein n=1 Tax=Paracoccus cavernae TaxID=1571207 RepID=A0ABT8D1C2_9RHOB|nr:hypothetical protein [Paracoccus cavernae]MDN3713508.1 hypothetical protein [Paracoccus cavernae]
MSAGAGGGEESDLAIATRIATMIETQFGLGAQGPIWSGVDEFDKLDAATQDMIRKRLRKGEDRAAVILRQHQEQLIAIARALQQQRHLSSADLQRTGFGNPSSHHGNRPMRHRRNRPGPEPHHDPTTCSP